MVRIQGWGPKFLRAHPYKLLIRKKSEKTESFLEVSFVGAGKSKQTKTKQKNHKVSGDSRDSVSHTPVFSSSGDNSFLR